MKLATRTTLLLVAFLTTFQITFAQQKTITGRVTDAQGNGLPGVSVIAKGSSTGTQTSSDGSYSLSVANSVNTLVFSSVGFGSQEVSISGRTSVDVAMESTAQDLNAVVVVGYGTARRRDLTGAVSQVREKDFNKGIQTAPDQLIQGKVAGVQVLNNSGQPGGQTTVRIRGNSSLRSGNQPLYVVDGVPLSGGDARPGLGGITGVGYTPGANPLNFINPNDIATIDVLKDASATAIYGSRGSNGVILITTKKGLGGVPKIEFNTYAGFSKILKRPEILDAAEYRAALKSYNLTSGDFRGDVDAFDAILQTGFTQNYNVGISGGNENGRYRVSLGYLDQEGIVKESDLKKFTANLSTSFKFLESKRLSLDFNIIASRTTENLAPITNDAGFEGNLVSTALVWNPTHPLYKPGTDSIFINNNIGADVVNPLTLLAAHNDVSNLTNILASISPAYKLTTNLEYRFLYSIRYGVGVRRQEVKRFLNVVNIKDRGVAQYGNNEDVTQQFTNTLSYNKALSSTFNVNAVIGHEYMKFDYRGISVFGQDFIDVPLNYTDYLQNSSTNSRAISSFANPLTYLQSFFGRATVNINDRFLLTGTIRADGSSKFGENNKYGYFPSFAAAWNISNENFLDGNPTISNLKLRLGYGLTGNQEFPAGASQTRYAISQSGTNRTNFGNKDLKWETSKTANAGIDFAIFRDRLSGSLDYFNKKTTDILFEQTVAAPGPGGKFWVNLPGEIENSGFEVALNAGILRKQDLAWNLGFNAAFLKNILTGFGAQVIQTGNLHGQGISGTSIQRLANNQPLNVFYLRNFEGIDKTTGQSIYTDAGNTLYFSGDPNPNVILGIATDLTYKKWALSVNMNGAFGHQIYNNTNTSVIPLSNLGTRNVARAVISGAATESRANALAASTRYLEKGDYLKLSNATLSYHLGTIARVFRNANVFITGQNLFVITDYSGFDPEVNTDKSRDGVPSFGIEYTPYPTARTFLIGANFSF